MYPLLLIAQLAAAVHAPLAPSDSAALHARVAEAEFVFMMDWRVLWQTGRSYVRQPANFDPDYPIGIPSGLGCAFESHAAFDIDQHDWLAHLIQAPSRPRLSLCPSWGRPNWVEPPDERKGIDASLSPEAADGARARRQKILALIDSAALALPGDGWIAGQRVRLHLDQTEIGAARAAAVACHGERWWCTALSGYVDYSAGRVTQASATFDRARAMMPDSVRCAWDDVSMLFAYTGQQAYQKFSCAQRDSVNAVVWWLSDPLYIENGNERRTENDARHVLIELHQALDADERFDWRDEYQGPALRAMILRYGWPTQLISWEIKPLGWHGGDTRSVFLGDTTIGVALGTYCVGQLPQVFMGNVSTRNGLFACSVDDRKLGTAGTSTAGRTGKAPPNPASTHTAPVLASRLYPIPCYDGETFLPLVTGPPCNPYLVIPGIKYWGPQFHPVPLWQTVLDPLHATDDGWDLAAPRDGPYWDSSWWSPEFYRRDAGPLVPLASQTAFFRRQNTAILATAMSFDTVAYLAKPADQMTGAAILSPGPYAPFGGARDTMSGSAPHPIVAAVASGPALLSVEMVPRTGAGPAGRSRYGVVSPPPLRTVTAGELALSDIVLLKTAGNETASDTFVGMLPRMMPATLLRDPQRVSLFWELYGLGTGDTVNVSLKVLRRDAGNPLQHLGALLGMGARGDDSVVVQWTEPRPGDPTATLDGGVTIRPRGLVIDMSAYSSGQYTIEIVVQRKTGAPVRTVRAFRVERR